MGAVFSLAAYAIPELILKRSFLKNLSRFLCYTILCRKSSKFCINPSDLKAQKKSNDNTEENGIIAVPYFGDTYFSAGDGAINYNEASTALAFTENYLQSFLRIDGDLSKSPYN